MSPETVEPVPLALWGATGRMGAEILGLLARPGASFRVAQAVVSEGSRQAGRKTAQGLDCSAPGPLLPEVEVVVDFSAPSAVPAMIEAARGAGRPVVSGTTGLDGAQMDLLREAAAEIPVFWTPNFSVGVAALIRAVEAVLPLLCDSDVEIAEWHHGGKKDSPSGTALKILDAILKGPGRDSARVVHGRKGLSPRDKADIGLHSLRGGSNPGRHEVHLLGQSEDLVICHQVYGREAFARGALKAASFVRQARPGLYGMDALLEPERLPRTGGER